MKRFAYANLVRSFDNLDEYHPYGYSWDDSYMTTSTNPYSWTWNDIERATGASSRVLSLDTPGGPIELPDHIVPATFNSIDVEYGTEYWELDVDLENRIDNVNGLNYGGPGAPYRIDVAVPAGTDRHRITAMLEDDEFFHFTGVRFDDDRALKGAVAVRSDNQVPGYNFEYDIVPYQAQIPLGDTKRFSLRPHEIIMLGINNTTDVGHQQHYRRRPDSRCLLEGERVARPVPDDPSQGKLGPIPES